MRVYIKNKDFISEKLYKQNKKEIDLEYKRILVVFIMLNIALIPLSFERMQKVSKKTVENKNSNIINSTTKSINISEIGTWIENIVVEDIKDAFITKNKAEIRVSDLNGISKLSLNNKIEINKLALNGDKEYKLEVSLHEENK